MTAADWVISGLLLLAAAFALISLRRPRAGGCSGCSGCSGCAGRSGCSHPDTPMPEDGAHPGAVEPVSEDPRPLEK